MGRSVLYLANARLPTEKAHGHAIVKMCEAYAQAGLDVELWHSFRHQDDRRLAATTVYDYYGVSETFGVRTLKNVDVMPAEPWCPKPVFPLVVGAHDLAWGWYASRLVRRRAPDLCHTRDLALAFWLVQARVPTLLEVHDPPRGPRRRLVQQVASRTALRGVIALTDACREVLASFDVPESKTIVLGSCVDLAQYQALPARDECRQSLGLPRDRQIIGYVGRFEALGTHKGLATLIEAAGVLRRVHGLSPLVVCVGGPMTAVPDLLEAACASGIGLDDIRFVDHVPNVEVPTWIRACDIGVLPSTRSGHLARFSSPLKVFEFMAAGVPLVASDLPAVREILRHDENAWLVEPEDPSALASGLARLQASSALRDRLGQRARSDVDEHTWAQRAGTIIARFVEQDPACREESRG